MNIKRIRRRVRRDRANTNRSTLVRVRTHAYACTSSQCSRAMRRDGAGRGGAGRDATVNARRDCVGKRNVSLTAGVRYVLHTHLPRRGRTHRSRSRDPRAAKETESERSREKGPGTEERVQPTGCEGPPPAILNDAGTESNCALAQRCDLLIPFLSLESSLARSPRHSPRVPRDLGPGPLVELFREELARRQSVSFRCANVQR